MALEFTKRSEHTVCVYYPYHKLLSFLLHLPNTFFSWIRNFLRFRTVLILCSFIVLLCEVDLSPFATSITEKEQITKKLPYFPGGGTPIQKEMISHLLFINFLKMPPRGVETIINHSNNGREISSQCEHIIYKGLDSNFRLASNATQSFPSATSVLPHPASCSQSWHTHSLQNLPRFALCHPVILSYLCLLAANTPASCLPFSATRKIRKWPKWVNYRRFF